VLELILLVLSTFWLWETIRYTAERFIPAVFDATRPVHPLVVAAWPVAVLWPDAVSALGVAGATGLLVAATDRWFAGPPVVIPRRRSRGGLPNLP
jgi:hypothetical protein